MDISNPPSLHLACPQAEAEIEKYVHTFRDRGVDKIKYGHEGIMIILRRTQFLTLTQYLWLRNFNRTQRNIVAYSFASQPFTSRVMSTIILYENLHQRGYIYPCLSNILCLPKE